MTLKADAEKFTLRVTCDDRGQHPRVDVGQVTDLGPNDPSGKRLAFAALAARAASALHPVEADALVAREGTRARLSTDARLSPRLTNAGDLRAVDRVEVAHQRANGGRTFRFICPRCKRDVPMREGRLVRIVEGLAAANLRSVDLAKLSSSM